MQCLFCGKELALLKRLRGGGEFCSEAHRKEYQEQYEQLALARLLQAKPPAEPAEEKIPLGRQLDELPATPELENTPALESPYAEEPVLASVATLEAPAVSRSVSAKAAEPGDPAPLAGFLSEPVVPAVAPFELAGLVELDTAWAHAATPPSLPAAAAVAGSDSSASSGVQGSLPPAPRVEVALSLRALEHHTRLNERGLELREFMGPGPVMELHLRPEKGREPATAADAMEILMSPHPPQKAKSWLSLAHGFPPAPAELGDLARLDFATTGFAYSDAASHADAAQASRPAEPVESAPVESAPEIEVAPAPAAAQPAPPEFVAPELVTNVLPVTLHGLAALRGKLAQAYTSAIIAPFDVQIPAPGALPLRPAIVFGPAPAAPRAPEPAAPPVQQPVPQKEAKKEVPPKPAQPKTAASQPAPVAPAPATPSQATPAQATPSQAKEERSRTSSVVPVPKAVPIKRQAAPETVPEKPAAKAAEPAVKPRPAQNPEMERRAEPPARKPVETAASFETSIPSLGMEANQSAWSKLSTGLKIGVAAAVIVGLSGIAYLVTRGSGKPAGDATSAAVTATPSVAAGVPISGGWIDDWANFSRSRRHITVLSGSAKLSDYRLEFQSQIETKAIGWIFRGLNARNYYVTKLEIVTPGLEPTVALVHFAVVDGQDENRVVVPLPLKVRIDTTYKIRFDAVGNRFTTWVQDQKIDEWTDSRFGSGGVGFFSERDEHAGLQGSVNVVALVPKN